MSFELPPPEMLYFVWGCCATVLLAVLIYLLGRQRKRNTMAEVYLKKLPDSLGVLPELSYHERIACSDFTTKEVWLTSKDFSYQQAEAGLYRLMQATTCPSQATEEHEHKKTAA